MKLKEKVKFKNKDIVHSYRNSNKTNNNIKTINKRNIEDILKAVADPSRAELRKIITELSTEERAELYALVLLGRGDRKTEDWKSLINDGMKIDGEVMAGYLIQKNLGLSKYIDQGLAKLNPRVTKKGK